MLKNLGTFTAYSDPRRNGSTFKNEQGRDWQRMVFQRVLFNDFGVVLELYEDGTDDQVKGDRFFAAVKDGKVTTVTRDLSVLIGTFPSQIIETDQSVVAGMVFDGTQFLEPEPEPEPAAVVYRTNVMSGLKDEHYETWDTAWPKLPAKQRILWDSVASYTYGTAEYREAQSTLLALIGADAYEFFPK